MKEIVPQNIRSARHLRGLSMEALARKMGGIVSKQSISKYERGLTRPSEKVFLALSSALELPPDYFYEQHIRIRGISFRTDKEIPTYATEQLASLAQDRIERYLKIEKLLEVPQTFSNPVHTFKIHDQSDIEKAAAELRTKWEIGCFPIFSVYAMLESLGIKIMEFDVGVAHVIGFSTMANGKIPLIIINLSANRTTERKRFTALHELGHLLLDFESGTGEEMKERFCNLFAGALLCPPNVMFRELGRSRTSLSLEELTSLKIRYGISIAAIVHRAKDLKIISEKYYNHIFNRHIHKNPMEEGWGYYSIPECTDRFLRLLQRALAEKIISREEAEKIAGPQYSSPFETLTLL